MLVDEIKRRAMAALKGGRTVEKEVLRVVLGEVQVAGARGAPEDDEAVMAVVRRLIKANEETLAVARTDAQRNELTQEIEVLRTLLPQSLSVSDIVLALDAVKEGIRGAGNDGQATGVAMKHLKGLGAVVNGKDVSEAVRQIRK